MSDTETHAPPPLPLVVDESNRGRPCLYGCLALGVAMAVLVGGIVLGFMYLGRQMVNNFTDEKPMPITRVRQDPARLGAVTARVDAFSKALETGQGVLSLELTADELNLLFQYDPRFADFGKWVYFHVDNDKVSGDLSLPLGALGVSAFGMANRYINGRATLSVGLSEGKLFVYMDALELNGQQPGPEAMSALRTQNLAKAAMHDPAAEAFFAKIDRIETGAGKIIVTRKGT